MKMNFRSNGVALFNSYVNINKQGALFFLKCNFFVYVYTILLAWNSSPSGSLCTNLAQKIFLLFFLRSQEEELRDCRTFPLPGPKCNMVRVSVTTDFTTQAPLSFQNHKRNLEEKQKTIISNTGDI